MTTPILEPTLLAEPPITWLIDILRGGDPAVVVSRRNAPVTHVELERYTVFPSEGDPKLLITASSNRVRSAALRRVGSETGTAMKLVRRIGSELARAGLDQLATGDDVVLSVDAKSVAEAPGDRDALTLVEHLQTVLGRPGLHIAVTIGPMRPNRKPVLQIMDADGHLIAYAKVGWDVSTRAMVHREAHVLGELAEQRLRSVMTPSRLHIGEWRDLVVLVTEPLDHPDAGVPDAHLVAVGLSEIATHRGLRTSTLASSSWLASIRERATVVGDGTLTSLVDGIEAHLGLVELEFGVSHGDWAPWNMARLGRRLGVWDWERASNDAPLGIDVVHHHFQQRLADLGSVGRALDACEEAVATDLERLGSDEDTVAHITTLYLVELALRYAESGLRTEAVIHRTGGDVLAELTRRVEHVRPADTPSAESSEPLADRGAPPSNSESDRSKLFGRRMLGGGGVPAPARDALKGGVKMYGRATSAQRVLPNTFIVGAQRAGTTSLFRYLTQHPSVTGPMLEKGVHYFDTNYSRDLDWYRSHFPTARAARLSRQRNGCDLRVVEASPYYLFHPCVPERIAAEVPDARFIVLVRDPAARALSHHNHEVKRGFETETFDVAIDLEKERLDGTIDDLLADSQHVSFAHQHHSYLSRGHYETQLERYDEHFGSDRVLVLRTVDLERDPAATVARALDFLSIPLTAKFTFPRFNARAYSPMEDEIEKRLRQEFAPTTAALGERLELDDPWA